MKVVDIVAYKRDNLHKSHTRHLRKSGQVPAVVYGGTKPLHVAVPAILFRKILRSKYAQFVRLNLEGEHIDCLLQEVQYHPVADHILHVDFLVLSKQQIKMYVPLQIVGQAPGLLQGGNLQSTLRKVQLRALPENMPASIEVDVSTLEIGQSIKVDDLPKGKYKILEQARLPVIGVQVPKALRSATTTEQEADTKETTEETATEEPKQA